MIYKRGPVIELLHKGDYKGYNFYIYSYGTHPCAYVEIPKGHTLYGVHYDNINIPVHGGFTFSSDYLRHIYTGNWFIGWDYHHAYDYDSFCHIGKMWTTEEIYEEVKEVIERICTL